MDWPDVMNATFEGVGAVLLWKSVAALRKDKKVRGVYWPAWVFFAVWGWWNILYYGPVLDQWISWWAGLVLVSANTTWVFYAIQYRKN